MKQKQPTIVLDYSEYIEDRHEYVRRGPLNAIQRIDEINPSDVKRFFSKRGYCPFCMIIANQVHNYYDHYVTGGRDLHSNVMVWECQECGWWELLDRFSEEQDFLERVDFSSGRPAWLR
jgi:restriction system protein